jgi:transposase
MLNHTHQRKYLRRDGSRNIEAKPEQRRYRHWSEEEKARIVTESFMPRANISEVARRNGVSGGLLFKWRRKALQTSAASAPFIPVTLATAEPQRAELPTALISCGMIEIELAGAWVRVAGSVDKGALITVLAALWETA